MLLDIMNGYDSAKEANGSPLRYIKPSWLFGLGRNIASGHDTHARSRVSLGFTA
jgi:hypothetical protein